MQAALLESFGSPLSLLSLPDPVPAAGEVVVDVAAAPVLPYMREVLAGSRNYLFGLPAVPGAGAVGRVRAVGPDCTRLAPGDWVFCDPTVRSRDDASTPDIVLQGLSARGPGGLALQAHFRDGSFAARMRVPAENAFRIDVRDADADGGRADAARWCALNLALVPYGGLLAAGLQAGETVLVSGATGGFGSAAVAVALAMGAGCVVAPGRNAATLADLARRFGPRVRTVALTGDGSADTAAMRGAAPSAIDCVLDILPPSAGAQVSRAAALSVREGGRVVLMGGVGMLGGDDLALPYPWLMRNNVTVRGQWMYPRAANLGMRALVGRGLLDLSQWAVTAFPLARANEALDHAAAHGGPFRLTVLQP
jgi:alcohol dehydrogenase